MVLVFQTNITTPLEKYARQLLSAFHEIITVDFDFEDVDNILRIETQGNIAQEVELTINSKGLFCRELP
ncbi:MAG: hypothetical protein V7724_12425 [Sediminicola sp.]|tara:strand:+ start:8007 stop:8213 length:207 start_codon:yes stop_codon:yes gene_type:complete